MKATAVTAGLAENNGSLLPGLWRDSLHVTCRLTACAPGSAPGPTLGNEYGKTLPLLYFNVRSKADVSQLNLPLNLPINARFQARISCRKKQKEQK